MLSFNDIKLRSGHIFIILSRGERVSGKPLDEIFRILFEILFKILSAAKLSLKPSEVNWLLTNFSEG